MGITYSQTREDYVPESRHRENILSTQTNRLPERGGKPGEYVQHDQQLQDKMLSTPFTPPNQSKSTYTRKSRSLALGSHLRRCCTMTWGMDGSSIA